MASSTANFWDKKAPYEYWIESTGAPIHRKMDGKLNRLMTIVSRIVLAMVFCGAAGAALAAQAKPGWQIEWEKILEAAKKEGQLSIYISGYEEILPEFQKEYPEIKVVPTTGRGSQVGQRLIAERRAENFLPTW